MTLLTINQVVELLPVSRATFFRTTRNDPSFPQSEKIGAREVWLKSDIEEYAGLNLYAVELWESDVNVAKDRAIIANHHHSEHTYLYIYRRMDDAMAAKLGATDPIRLVDASKLRPEIEALLEVRQGGDENEIGLREGDLEFAYCEMFRQE